MVKESAKINHLFKKFCQDFLAGKKRFTLTELEEFLIDRAGGVTDYEEAGGYRALHRLLRQKEEQNELRAIKSAPYNGRLPALKTRWQLVEVEEEGWPDKLVFKLSRQLDLGYYLKRPSLQTEELAGKLQNLRDFLVEKEGREWASREERSLELFGDEKFLSEPEGRKLLSRLNLSLADIKAEKYSQMFVYWTEGTARIRKILILENHSAFIACKRALEDGYLIFDYRPDTLIYGSGKHILDSFKFLREIADPERVKIKYAGDIDPEGLAIYTGLQEKYSASLALHVEYYREMLRRAGDGYPLQKDQQKRDDVLGSFLQCCRRQGLERAGEIRKLWRNNRRIPQEVITYEVLVPGSARFLSY